jgi:hypothetical protein
MGRRHGTGGSEDANERGDTSAFWGPQDQQPESFWGPGEQQPEPGWPSLPDQVEVTGQWAPMPQPADDVPAAGPQSDPFEVTGAFAAPPRTEPGRPYVQPEQPFESTGAFARPASWDDAPDATQALGPVDQAQNAFGQDRPGAFEQPQDRPSVFDRPQDRPNVFDQHPQDRPGSYDRRPQDDSGPWEPQDAADPFGRHPGAFGQPGGFDRAQGDQSGPFGRPGGFDEGPAERTGAFDPFPGDRTARFDPPAGSAPPEPGDIKVAGAPTAVAPTPAWAEADSAFLGAGWSSDEGGGTPPEAEQGRRRGRRKQSGSSDALDAPTGGRGKLALLSVAAVAVVLGGTVAGVKMMSSSGSDPASCPGGTCAAVQASNQPGPAVSEDAVDDSEPVDEPVEEPSEEAEPADTPTPKPTYSPQPRRAESPSPKPTKTKSKRAQAPTEEPIEEIPEDLPEETPEPTPSQEKSSLGDTDYSRTTPTTSASPQATATTQAAPSGGSVNVKFDVVKQGITGYIATMNVTNAAPQALRTATLSMPVRGRVTDVDGAEWTQDGNLLIVDLSSPLAAGGSSEISIKATGRAGEPRSCGMVGGECAVS